MNKKLVDRLERYLALGTALSIWVQTHGCCVSVVLSNFVLSCLLSSFDALGFLVLFAQDILVTFGSFDINVLVHIKTLIIFLLNHSTHFRSWFVSSVFLDLGRFWFLCKFNFLISVFQINIGWLLSIVVVSFLIYILHHVFGNTLGHAQRIDLFGRFIFNVRYEERAFNLLFVEFFRVDAAAIF